ncbi:hypothetical protein Hanom_Chr00s000002g01599811 [Helianthus anomalus]
MKQVDQSLPVLCRGNVETGQLHGRRRRRRLRRFSPLSGSLSFFLISSLLKRFHVAVHRHSVSIHVIAPPMPLSSLALFLRSRRSPPPSGGGVFLTDETSGGGVARVGEGQWVWSSACRLTGAGSTCDRRLFDREGEAEY